MESIADRMCTIEMRLLRETKQKKQESIIEYSDGEMIFQTELRKTFCVKQKYCFIDFTLK